MQKTQTKRWYEDESFWRTFASTMFHSERLEGKEVIARIWRERDWHEQDGRIFLRESKISQGRCGL